jgi:steroid delta-isomerase-like uncharacterized protein
MDLALEEKKRIVKDILEKGWNLQQFEDFSNFLAESTVFNFRGTKFSTNLEQLKELIAMWRTAFPDFHFQLRDIIAENELVAVNLVFTGTHKGQWENLPPSGNKIRVEEMMFFRFDQGKIVEIWEVFDELEMRNQISAQAV